MANTQTLPLRAKVSITARKAARSSAERSSGGEEFFELIEHQQQAHGSAVLGGGLGKGVLEAEIEGEFRVFFESSHQIRQGRCPLAEGGQQIVRGQSW